MLRFDELLRDNQVVTGEDVECRELPFDSFPVGLVWLTTVLRGGRHQCFIAHLVANIVRFPTAIGTAELEFEDLLSRCFPKWIAKAVLTFLELLALDRMLVGWICLAAFRNHRSQILRRLVGYKPRTEFLLCIYHLFFQLFLLNY